MRQVLTIGFVVAVVTVATSAATEPPHNIELTADVPTVTVAPRPPGQLVVHLPGLSYAMTVTIDCTANWVPDSVSISVADSGTSLDAEQLQAGVELELELRIPANQIAPLRIEKFCTVDDKDVHDTANQERIYVPGFMSAQASLRCATDSEQLTMYVTKPLDVVLKCAAPEAEDN